MRFKFSKLAPNGFIDVTITDDYGAQHIAGCCVYDGIIEVVELYTMPNTEELARQVNDAYSQHKEKKLAQRNNRTALREVNHWWNATSKADKERLVMPLRDRLIEIVDALLTRNPNDIKRKHYDALIKRSQLNALRLDRKLDAKKLAKLPHYSAVDDKLHGSLYSFIALAEVCYPSLRETKASHLEL